jgi:hypothetical protein
LEDQDAVSTPLADKKSMMGAIQRPDFVSILARRGRTAVDHPSHECGIIPDVFRPKDIARRQSLNLRISLVVVLRKSGV